MCWRLRSHTLALADHPRRWICCHDITECLRNGLRRAHEPRNYYRSSHLQTSQLCGKLQVRLVGLEWNELIFPVGHRLHSWPTSWWLFRLRFVEALDTRSLLQERQILPIATFTSNQHNSGILRGVHSFSYSGSLCLRRLGSETGKVSWWDRVRGLWTLYKYKTIFLDSVALRFGLVVTVLALFGVS